RAPSTTLDYIRVLRWPVLVLFMVLLFRTAIAHFLRETRLARARTPWGDVELHRQPGEQASEVAEEGAAALASSDEDEELLSVYLEQEEVSQQEINQLYEQIAAKDIQIEFERLLNMSFESQLRLLRFLSVPPRDTGSPREHVQQFQEAMSAGLPIPFDQWI